MDTGMSTKIMERIAESHGVSFEQVRDEMAKSIEIAFENRADNEVWRRYFGEQAMPSPEEFIAVLASALI